MATTTTATLQQLPKQSAPWTHVAVVTAADLTDPSDNSNQTIEYPLPLKCRVEDALLDVRTPFTDAGDATFDDMTLTVQDNAATAATFIASTLISGTSTVTLAAMNKATLPGQIYLTGTPKLQLVFNPETNNNLLELDHGEARVYLAIQKPGQLG